MIVVAYGTRPEIIKLFPVIEELKQTQTAFQTLFTGQHIDLFEDVKDLVPEPDFHFVLPEGHANKPVTLGASFISICKQAEELFNSIKPRIVLVQGDTTTAWAIAQMAFYNGIKVGHIEAGLRTFDLENPFPEELNRTLISQLSYMNFAPTTLAQKNLFSGGARNIYLTGNTIVDAIHILMKKFQIKVKKTNNVLITLHRRENHPHLTDIFEELQTIATRYQDLTFTFPIHPNPEVRKHAHLLTSPNIRVVNPVNYPDMLKLIAESFFIISDSGGIQEEACCLGKKVLIVRKTTERTETVEAGYGKLVGKDIVSGVEWAMHDNEVSQSFPYGCGDASQKIVSYLRA